ncbi:MAG: alpha-amylase family glycosyl hydrolase [Limnoraphis sp.]
MFEISNSPSNRGGMGSIPYETGTTFRVWVPFANAVFVAGKFNNWNDSSHPLTSEGNGNWSADIEDIAPDPQDLAEYKYVIHNGGQTLWKKDPQARDVTNSNGNSVVINRDYDWQNNFSLPGWNELVIYQMHVGTFFDDDAPGLGNFDSINDRLDQLANLGINAIQLLPITEFPTDISWGYNVSDPFAIESAFGTVDDFKKFVDMAHGKGIGVLNDVIYNHFGPQDLELWQFDGWSENGGGGIYFYNNEPRKNTPFGARPDYGRGEVRQYIRDNALMWLEEYRLDGLRFDATAFIRNAFGNNNDPFNDIPDGWNLMQWINNEIASRQGGKIPIAEDIRGNEFITRDTGAGGAGFGSQWAGEFFGPIRDAIVAPSDSSRNMFAVRDALYHRFNTDAFERVIYTENHDEVSLSLNTNDRPDHYRIPEQIWRGNADSWFSRKRSTLGGALVFTAPGIPMIFQGQEFLEWGGWRAEIPLDWRQRETFSGIWDLYQSLIRLRRNWFNNTRGLRGQHINVHHVNNNDKLIAFHRWENGGAGDDVIVVANFADRNYNSYSIGFPFGGTWYVRFNSDWSGYSSDFGNQNGYDTNAEFNGKDGMAFNANIGIGAYSVLILSQ